MPSARFRLTGELRRLHASSTTAVGPLSHPSDQLCASRCQRGSPPGLWRTPYGTYAAEWENVNRTAIHLRSTPHTTGAKGDNAPAHRTFAPILKAPLIPLGFPVYPQPQVGWAWVATHIMTGPVLRWQVNAVVPDWPPSAPHQQVPSCPP